MSLFRLIPGVLVVSVLATEAAPDPKLDALLQRVEDRYNTVKTLQVLFTEQYTPPGSIRRTTSGQLSLRKPGHTRWEYSQPKGKLWISDGKYIWMYDPSDNSDRAAKMKFKESEDMRAPIAFLLGKLHFNKEFQNLQAQPDGAGTRVTAEPRGENLPYSMVEFVVTPGNQIREVKVTGFDRSILDFTFDQEKLDPPLNASLFRFQAPAGVTVVEETSQ